MLKVFKATDKTYSSNGDLIVNPLKAQVHKEDNGEFYLDLETPFNEKEVSIAKEEGTYTTINGTATIQNVSANKLQEVLQLDGDTTQETTTGKNLLVNTNHTQTINGITFTVNEDKSITIKGTATAQAVFRINETGSYTLNAGNYVLSTVNNLPTGVVLQGWHSSATAFVVLNPSSNIKTTTLSENVSSVRFQIVISNGTNLSSGITIYPMLESGSTASSYEPYTNGASPNPDYPQPINVVSGRQEVVVAGKNLLNIKDGSYSYSTTNTWEVQDHIVSLSVNDITYQGGVLQLVKGATARWAVGTNNNITSNGGTYTLSVIKNGTITYGTNNGFVCLYCYIYKDDGTVRQEQLIIRTNDSSFTKTITLANDEHFGEITLYSQFIQCENVEFKIMLEKGNQATTYEAYKGQSYEINLGKNLNFTPYKDGTSKSTNGIQFTVNNDGSITANNTATAVAYFYCHTHDATPYLNIEKGIYYLSGGVSSSCKLNLRLYNNTTYVANFTDSGNGVVVDTRNYTYNRVFLFVQIESGTQCDNVVFKPMLEKGSQATTYSSYKTPIELCKIGNYQDFIKKGTGKNLFDKNNITSGKRLGQNGQLVDDTNYFTSDFIPVKEETWCTKNSPTIDAYHRICYYSSNNESSYISRVDDNSFPTPANTKYVRFCGALTEVDTTMFNEGNTALPYEPYGMYNKWYIEKQIGKVVLNGSETWNKNNDNRYYLSQYGRYFKYNGSTDEYVLMSDIAIKPTNSSSTSEYKIYNNWNGNIFINHLNIASEYTTSQWATAMTGHYIYGVLTTPTYTEITDEELLTQINSIKLIEGLNNVSITSPYLTAPIYIHYNYIDEVSYSIKYNDYLIPNNIIVANTPQGEQAFRISNVEKTRRKIKIKANHVFYDSANLLIQDSYVVDKNCNDALDHLNNATSDLSPFTTISNINVIDSYRCVRKSLFQAIQVVIERWGGHLVRDNWTIGVYDTIGQDNGVTIRYAKNLKDITATYIWDDVVTKLLPVGKDGILLNELDPTASVYVESAVKYDIPYTKTISFEQNSIIEDDYKDENGTLILEDYKQALIDDLYAQATEYITNNYLPKVNYTLSANVEKISDIGDTIEVIDEKLGINIMTNVISYDYDCILDKYIEIEFGNFTPELSNLMNSITENTERIVREENSTLAITLGRELEEATDKIWSALGNSYVIYDGDKILVVDSLPKETATNVIMINNGGIGFSNTGITGTFSSAWTIDNVLNMENINVINLTADLIKGGTLKLGSNLNQNGQIEVYDEANSLIAELNKNGLKMYGVDGSYVLMNNQVGFAGYDRNDNPIYWVNGDEFHMKKSVVEEEITLVNKMRIIPITIRDGNNQIVNDGIGFVNVAN